MRPQEGAGTASALVRWLRLTSVVAKADETQGLSGLKKAPEDGLSDRQQTQAGRGAV